MTAPSPTTSTVTSAARPDLTVPDLTVPNLTVPDLTVSGMTAPGMTAPGMTVPGMTVGTLTGQVMIIAKEPVPGCVKTRLTPPFSPRQAADLAQAALADTLAAAAGVTAARQVIALDGTAGPWLPAGVHVLPQRGAGLDERIAAAFADAYAQLDVPVVLIGMDTPQVTPELLESALSPLADGTADAVIGPAADGGFWLLGLRRPDPGLVLGVPMSTSDTGAAQVVRLAHAGLRIRWLRCLQDVDTAADAYAVARQAPRTRFAAALAAMPSFLPPEAPPPEAPPTEAPPPPTEAPTGGATTGGPPS